MESLGSVARQFGFNPLEKRDGHGRWTIGGKIKSVLKGGDRESGSGKPPAALDRLLGEHRRARGDLPSASGSKVGGKVIKQVGARHERQDESMNTRPQTLGEAAAQAKLLRSPGARSARSAQKFLPGRRPAFDDPESFSPEDQAMLRREAARLYDLDENGASGPDAERQLNELTRLRKETPQQRLRRLYREAAAADMD